MIQFFHRSHAKKSGLLSDWLGKKMDDLCCSDWPNCRHPLVVVDFSPHFCLAVNTHTSSAGSDSFLEFLKCLNFYELYPLKYFPSHRILKSCRQKFTDH